jgi:peptide/nickel transport system substrate-binding protein
MLNYPSLVLKRAARFAALGALASAPFVGTLPAIAQQSDTLVIGRAMDVNSLDPARAFCDTCQIYLSAVYEPLVTLGKDNKTLVAGLADAWEANDTFTDFTFTIRNNAVFSDGSPVEASDVVWSFERLKNLKGSPSFLMDGVASVTAVDGNTVNVTLEAPNAEFLNKLSAPYSGIINAEMASAAGAVADDSASSSDKAENWFLENSAGSGPFTLSNYSPDNELRFARNDNYWGDAPHFSEVVITQIQDAVSQSQALESGAVDIAMQVDADTAVSISTDDVVTKVVPSFNFLYIAFMPGAEGMADVLTPEVREALSLAINYDEMIEFTVGGNGNPQAAPIPNGFPGTANLPLRHQDLDKAKAMLASAGYADGFDITAGYPNDNVYGVDINVMMQKAQQDLAKVGVDMKLRPLTYAVWREDLNNGALPITGLYYAPDYFGSGQYPSYFAMMPGTTWLGRAGQKTPEVAVNPAEAGLYAAALAKSGAEADAAYEALAMEMISDNIIVPLVSPNLVLAYRSDIEGVRYSACCNLPLAELSRK